MKMIPIDPREKICRHLDALFGSGVSDSLSSEPEVQFEYSKKTGRIKNFSIGHRLAATLRTDGGLALSIHGAQYFLEHSTQFLQNCVIPAEEAIPFVSEGRSLFCKHVEWCGSNVNPRSDVAIIVNDKVVAVGRAILGYSVMKQYRRGVAVKVRQGIKGRTELEEL